MELKISNSTGWLFRTVRMRWEGGYPEDGIQIQMFTKRKQQGFCAVKYQSTVLYGQNQENCRQITFFKDVREGKKDKRLEPQTPVGGAAVQP